MRLNGFDLNQIVCLHALLTERSVTRAAERVHLSQSAMSAVLAQLRRHFEDPLLVRAGRRLVATPFARSLVEPAGQLIEQARAFTALAPGQVPATIERELRIVASDYLMAVCLAEAIRRAGVEMPNLRFDILPLTATSADGLRVGDVDLLLAGQAFTVAQPPDALVLEDRFVCLACARHGPTGEDITAEDYLARRHVAVRYFEHRMAFEDEEAIRRHGLMRPRHVTVWSYLLVPQLICGTAMLATVTRRIAERLVERWPVKLLPFPLEQDSVRVYAYWHQSRSDDPVLARFMQILATVVDPGPAGREPLAPDPLPS